MLNSTTNSYLNGAKETERLLSENGFRYVWLNQGVENEHVFLNNFTIRIQDKYLQDWYSIVRS